VYKGNWLGGFRHGKGTMRWVDGTVYEGEWRYGQPCFKGKMTFPSDEVFEGDWANSRRNGQGTCKLPG